jgi:hypothetical protein
MLEAPDQGHPVKFTMPSLRWSACFPPGQTEGSDATASTSPELSRVYTQCRPLNAERGRFHLTNRESLYALPYAPFWLHHARRGLVQNACHEPLSEKPLE